MKTNAKNNLAAVPNLLERLEFYLNRGVNIWQVTAEAGVPHKALQDWIHRDIEPEASILEKIGAWLEGNVKARQQAKFKGAGYLETETANRIVYALDHARFKPGISTIYGGAGVGKSTTLRHYAKVHKDRTWLVEAADPLKSTVAILMELVESPSRRGFAYRKDSLFKEALDMMLDTGGYEGNSLLIIDEAQHLETPTFEAIRAFHDRGIGIAYAGNEEVYSRIHGKKASKLAQLSSRVTYRLRLENSTSEDADMFITANEITGREARDYCQRLAALPGGLRNLDNLFSHARILSAGTDGTLSIEVLKEAAKDCGVFQ